MAAAMAATAAGPVTQPATQDPLSGAMPTLAPSDVHVLLVDDERLSRVVVGNVLRKCAYRGEMLSRKSWRGGSTPSVTWIHA
jgi:hypothetical protein